MNLPALSPFSPLASVLQDIERAAQAQLYYPALLVALTVPEICCALALDNSVFVKEKHYAAFVDKFTTQGALGLDGQSCYRLRGGLVHRANAAGHPYLGATHVIFTTPETQGGIHGIIMEGLGGDGNIKRAAILDLARFCTEMIAGAFRWYEDHQNDPKVTENMNNLIRYLPGGLSPFVRGAPVVASGSP